MFSFLFSIAFFITHLASSPVRSEKESEPFVFFEELQLYHTRKSGCGQLCLYLVLQYYGFAPTMSEIVGMLPAGERGVSMREIAIAVETHGLKVSCVNISVSELTRVCNQLPNCCGVAWIGNNHWVFVAANNDSELMYFQYPGWNYCSDRYFTENYTGKSIVIMAKDQGGLLHANFSRIVFWSLLGSLSISVFFFKKGLLLRLIQCTKSQ